MFLLFIIIGTRQQLLKVDIEDITIGQIKIKVADSLRNLGIIFDKEMGLNKQVQNTCKKV